MHPNSHVCAPFYNLRKLLDLSQPQSNLTPYGKTNGDTEAQEWPGFASLQVPVGWGVVHSAPGDTGRIGCPPDVLVPLYVEAVEVVVGHVAAVPTLLEPLDDGQLHAHGDVGGQH